MDGKIFKKRFDSANPNWDKNVVFNEMFLRTNLVMLDDLLKNRNVLTLLEVYGYFGFDITRESCTYGWCSKCKELNIDVDFYQIGDSNEFEVVFKCYPILKYLPSEDEAV